MAVVYKRLMVGVLLVLLLAIASTAAAETVVEFPDAALEEAVREALREWGSPLTTGDLARLSTLVAQKKDIRDLRGLEHAINLTRLDLAGNDVANLAPLAGLTRLENLSLKHNRITDLTSLRNLSNLTYLSLEGNNISEISAISGLTNLTRLNVGENRLQNLSPLRNLGGLEQLVAYYNEISDLSPVAGLTRLQVLNLSDNNISDLSPLVTNLRSGGLSGAYINVTNNRLDLSEGSAIEAVIRQLDTAGVEMAVGSQAKSVAGPGSPLPDPIQMNPPGGARSDSYIPEEEGQEVINGEAEPVALPAVDAEILPVWLAQSVLVFAVILVLAMAFVCYRIVVLLVHSRRQKQEQSSPSQQQNIPM
ncbi:leucine-rich repeat domain-containing protein [Dethiobacter alkaliphilus]|uniref:leucine-rich repeat domain-containing protein n=1 Tax=Dethiobacter alkaliphilus TaxID=427926 RepID=UPI002227A4F1|nr:leucine-rich repeat domain-containing protein [Dethiobacter alkaliphilus]MCW3490078.1 leucine-rich repeat domain-containing protein [Dethiobacter alkaliphilus]